MASLRSATMSAGRLNLHAIPSLRGKRILVTGGSQGVGRALALAFVGEGAHVSVCARHEGHFGALREAGIVAQTTDVADPISVERLMVQLAKEWGELDAVVNNAAVLHQGRLVEQPIADWRESVEVNLGGPFLVIRSALKIMTKGTIVNVTSGLGRFPMEPYGAYSVTKAGLNMLTRVLAVELGDRCRVNAIDPGEVRTRLNPGASEGPEAVVAVARALVALTPDGPTGRCFRTDGSEIPWE